VARRRRDRRFLYIVLWGGGEGKRPLGRHRPGRENDIKIDM